MEHERDNRTPEFDYAAALEEHHAKFPDSSYPPCRTSVAPPPQAGVVPQIVNAPRSPSAVPDIVNERNDYPAVVAPSSARLTSTVTYSDLPGGYDRVSVVEVEVGPTTRGTVDVRSSRRWVRFLENPNSVAILVVTPGSAESFHSDVAVTHRKLRYLFKDAIEWYLKERGVVVEGGVPAEFIKVDAHSAIGDAGAPVGITYMRVSPSGFDFHAPTTEAYVPSTTTILFTLCVISAIVFLAVQVYLILHGIGGGVLFQILLQTLRAIHDMAEGMDELLRKAAVFVLKLFGMVVLHVDKVLALCRELAEL
ncbi:hypothetical protein TRAPUB_13839 [Trametes pubescens]|uniref:Uncharacterized protein n=1 Tax=Trametes pubescens TaxID=154538 RepID=A0A1M2VQ36_TRAPU|nr:hypothetical protein TRAPUB_13839 [Trametes pubescens]